VIAKKFLPVLNQAVANAAKAAGVRFIGVSRAFDGHGICADDPWINGLTPGNDVGPLGLKIFGNESFHPNYWGHQKLFGLVEKVLVEDGLLN